MKNFVSSPAMTERKYLFLNIVMDSLTASRNSLFSLVDNLFISKFTRTIDALPCQSQNQPYINNEINSEKNHETNTLSHLLVIGKTS